MNFKPILFSTDMVRALLEDRKTMTRRVIKPKYRNTDICWKEDKHGKRLIERQNDAPAPTVIDHGNGRTTTTRHVVAIRDILCPYKIGSVLWVREEHYRYGKWKKNGLTDNGRQKWKFFPDPHFAEIRFFDNPPAVIEKNAHRSEGWYKRLARFMPKAACRIFLDIKNVRAERLQDINGKDAGEEGIIKTGSGDSLIPGVWYKDYIADASGYGDPDHDFPILSSPIESFASLWQKINGSESWSDNPWVWVISFKCVDKPGNFLI